MEMHIMQIIRFVVYVITVLLAILLMKRADDNDWLRRGIMIISAIIILFNPKISTITYLVLGTTLETIMTTVGIGLTIAFLLVLGLTIVIFPMVALFRWVIR